MVSNNNWNDQLSNSDELSNASDYNLNNAMSGMRKNDNSELADSPDGD